MRRPGLLIHAMRDSKCVPASNVRGSRAGGRQRVTTAVPVTAVWVSAETKASPPRNNRLRIIEGDEPGHVLAEYFGPNF